MRRGERYIKHIEFDYLKERIKRERFIPTTDFKNLKETDAIIICVPTPLNKRKEPDLTAVINTAKAIAEHLRIGQLIILESTTYPGTTKDVVLPILKENGLKAEKDFYLCFSPEREDPGNKKFTTRNIPKVVGGIGKKSLDLGALLYSQVVEKVVKVSSCEVAEATKMLENTFRAVNIALVNELKIFFNKLGVDIWEVIGASSTKPFGFMPFYPGPGWGGHCIPIDPFYLVWKAKESGISLKFIELAGEVNTRMPHYVVGRIGRALQQQKKGFKGAKILILGVAYKKDIDDIRESPALVIMDILEGKGASVRYYDPYVPELISQRHKRKMKSLKNLVQDVKEADVVAIVTDHSNIDYCMVIRNSKFIVDTRNVIKGAGSLKNELLKG